MKTWSRSGRVIRLPSAETPETDAASGDAETEAGNSIADEARQALLEAITTELGDAVVAHHHIPGKDLWIRVANEAWPETAEYLRNRQRFRYFSWLSAIDWKQSPFGRSHEAAVDLAAVAPEQDDSDSGFTETGADGFTGGATRFQVLARVNSLATQIGLTVKADVDEDLAIGTWTGTYPGAGWHERETAEMFGLTFNGNKDLRGIYLPAEFEGHPLRKDYPLMARLVKPWPGIVDVEPMPEVEAEKDGGSDSGVGAATTTNPEDAS